MYKNKTKIVFLSFNFSIKNLKKNIIDFCLKEKKGLICEKTYFLNHLQN